MEDEAHADQRYLLEQLANLGRQLCDEAVTCPADELQDLPDRYLEKLSGPERGLPPPRVSSRSFVV